MNFTATLRGVSFTDPKEFAAAVKAAPPLEPYTRAGKVVKVRTADLPAKPKVFEKPRVILTAAEREWLGATVQRRSDGAVGQVWALAPSVPGSPSGLWLVANGDCVRADIANVTLVQSRVDQLALSL